MSPPECSMLSCMQSSAKCWVHTPNGSSLSEPSASTTAAWAHLRALRDTGSTCHGTPDLGEWSSRAHAWTTCPWNAKRQRQDYGCTCMCGDSRGCPTSNGDKQAIRLTHRVHAELWTSGPQLVTGTTPPAANITTGQWTVWMGMGSVRGWPLRAVPASNKECRPQKYTLIHYMYAQKCSSISYTDERLL